MCCVCAINFSVLDAKKSTFFYCGAVQNSKCSMVHKTVFYWSKVQYKGLKFTTVELAAENLVESESLL